MIGGRRQRRPASNPICSTLFFGGPVGLCPSPSCLFCIGKRRGYLHHHFSGAGSRCLLAPVQCPRTAYRSERPFPVSALDYRLSMIAAILGTVNYVAYQAKWHAALAPAAGCVRSRHENALRPSALPPGIHRSHSLPSGQPPSVRHGARRHGRGWRWCALWLRRGRQALRDPRPASAHLSHVPCGNGLRNLRQSYAVPPQRCSGSEHLRSTSVTAVPITKQPRAFPLPEK